MTTATTATLVVGLSDVARLAQVQRSVVSMWRTRHLRNADPFPLPVTEGDAIVRFDGEEVVAWLERTNHGRNPDARADLASFVRPADAEAVALLLCLKSLTGVALADLDADDLVDLAEDADPNDAMLMREVSALGTGATALTGYTDRLADAAYTSARAFERVLADRSTGAFDNHIRTTLTPEARRLVAAMAVGLASAVDLDPPVFVDPTLAGSDLLVEIAARLADGSSPTVLTTSADHHLARFVRRRLRLNDIHREELVIETDGTFAVTRPAVLVAQFPGPDEPRMSATQILAAIDNIVVQMDALQWGVVVGPASALADATRSDEAEGIRDAVLRSDRLRAVVRLPKGLVIAAPRQPLAVWVLGPAHPDVPIGERWTVVGDIGDHALTGATVEDVVTDVVAALGSGDFVRRHAFRFCRRVPTTTLLTRRGGALVDAVVPRRHQDLQDPAVLALHVAALAETLGLTDTMAVEPGSGLDQAVSTASLGELLDGRVVRLVAGHRVAAEDAASEGGTPVVGTDELTGRRGWGSRRVDHLVLGSRYAAVQLTRPGDVIFCTSPTVAARLDRDGGSLVAAPARILRVMKSLGRTGSVLPSVLASDITAVAPQSKTFRLWPVRLVPPGQATAVSAALYALDDERARLAERLARLDDLSRCLIDGVTSGGLQVAAPTANDTTHHHRQGR